MFKGIHVCVFVALSGVVACAGTGRQDQGAPPPELGRIRWLRGFDDAVGQAKQTGKPILVLFQEVPGCHTCVSYGRDVLSHPLIVEVAETLFVPVAVYNNIEGPDKITLTSFQEKAWNNPVVRIVAADRTPLAPRLADDYTVAGLVKTMVQVLERREPVVPEYLKLLADETRAREKGLERATFGMHCFWEGEAALGKLPATIATRPGFVDKVEVVDVEFDPSVMPFEALVKAAKGLDCTSRVFTHSKQQQLVAAGIVGDAAGPFGGDVRPDKTPKYYLANSPYRYIPMTPTQASRVNAALGLEGDPDRFLSPRQLEVLEAVNAKPDDDWPIAVGVDMTTAWPAVWRRLHPPATGDD